MTTTSEMLEQVLKDLERSGVIRASAIASIDGLLIASAVPQDVDQNILAAMTSAMISSGQRVASALSKGDIENVVITAKEGVIISQYAGPNTILIGITAPNVGLGIAVYQLDKAVEKIKNIL